MPLPERLNTIFGFLAAAWMTLLSLSLKLPGRISIDGSQPALFLVGIGVVLGLMYRRLHHRCRNAPEEMFP
jgi:hypothetical protein